MRNLVYIALTTLGCGGKDGEATPDRRDDSGADVCVDRSYAVPSTRGELEGVWDAGGERFVFFGGDEGTPESCIPKPDVVSETWAFYPDCDNFELLEVSGEVPHERSRHAIALDAARGRMLVHGGRSRTVGAESTEPYTLYDDLWALDLETLAWSKLSEGDGASPRRTHAMVVAGDTLLVYGGNTATGSTSYVPSAQLWGYDLIDGGWTGLDGAAAAGGRIFHAAAVSDDGTTMYVYGGADSNALFGPFMGDLWAYDVASGEWSELHDGTSDAPDRRSWPDLVFDGASDRLLMFGGHDDQAVGLSNQIWAFDLGSQTWAQLEVGDVYNAPSNGFCDFPADFTVPDLDAPERRWGGAAVLSESDLMIFGGKTDCGQVNDLWTWSLDEQSWTERSSATLGEICFRTFADPEDCETLCF